MNNTYKRPNNTIKSLEALIEFICLFVFSFVFFSHPAHLSLGFSPCSYHALRLFFLVPCSCHSLLYAFLFLLQSFCTLFCCFLLIFFLYVFMLVFIYFVASSQSFCSLFVVLTAACFLITFFIYILCFFSYFCYMLQLIDNENE